MENSTKPEYSSIGEVLNSIRSIAQFIIRKWIWLGAAVVAGTMIGLAFYFTQKPKYEAITTFILEDKSGGGGGLAGLASQFGFNLGSIGSGAGMFSGDNIQNILESKKVVEKTLLTRVELQNPASKTLIELYLDFSGMRDKWKKRPDLVSVNFNNTSSLTPVQDSVLHLVYEKVISKNLGVDKVSKQGTIVRVQTTAADGTFARLLTERLVDEASIMYMTIKTGVAEANIDRMQRRADSLLLLLNRKSYSVAADQPLDLNPALRTQTVPSEIGTRDKTVLSTLYVEVMKNLEASKLLLSQQTPVIQLLDTPGITLENKKKGLIVSVILSVFFTGFITVLILTLSYFLSAVKSSVQRPAADVLQ